MFNIPSKEAQVWTVYILQCADGSLYTGITNDLENRLARHHDGTGAKYTRGRGPFSLLFQEEAACRGDALRREMEIKKMSRSAKLSLAGSRPREAGAPR